MGRRSVCDPFDAAAIVDRIATRENTAADAWSTYAASVARPCARSTFAGALSRARVSAGLKIAVKHERNLKRGVSGDEIRKRAGAGPVLVIGPDAALRVRGGALHVEHGSGKDRVRVRIDVDEPKPAAILFDAHGEFLTGEAIRWCARYAIPLILPNGHGRAILFYESAVPRVVDHRPGDHDRPGRHGDYDNAVTSPLMDQTASLSQSKSVGKSTASSWPTPR
jgi:hypothetical protein